MKQTIFLSAIVLFLTLTSTYPPLYAEPVSDFTLLDINSRPVSLSDYTGEKILFITFWVGRCAPCMDIMAELDKIVSENDDIYALAINIDYPRMVDRAKSLFRSQKYSFSALFDNNMQVARMFRVTSSGTTFILGYEGEIIYEHNGFNLGDEIMLMEKIDQYKKSR